MTTEINSTRLRFISSVDPEIVSLAVSSLPFKVEMKGGPEQSNDGLWYVWFIIPDNVPSEFPNQNFGAIE